MSGRQHGWRRHPRLWPEPLQWAALLTLSAIVSWLWNAAGLAAALLLGPMLCGMLFGACELTLAVPRWPYLGAQAIIGAMVAGSITHAALVSFGHDALLFCAVISATLLGSAALGWILSRTGLIPGPTAVYGTSPGAASAMVLLAEAEQADKHLVAFMQYTRVVLVALAAALIAHALGGASGVHSSARPFWAPVDFRNLMEVLALAAVGQQLARLIGLQAWAILGPLLLLSALHAGGWLAIELPRVLLAAAYALLGWHVGLGFRRAELLHAGRAMPTIIVSALCLMGFCGLLAWILSRFVHVDPLTAYLATSPGGLDSVAIISASSPTVDLPFVLALQSMRLLLVISLAPMLTRLIVRVSPHLRKSIAAGTTDPKRE